MDYKEAVEWLSGKRSMANLIPQDPFETWQVRIAQADAAMAQQAYYIVRAYEDLICPLCQGRGYIEPEDQAD